MNSYISVCENCIDVKTTIGNSEPILIYGNECPYCKIKELENKLIDILIVMKEKQKTYNHFRGIGVTEEYQEAVKMLEEIL